MKYSKAELLELAEKLRDFSEKMGLHDYEVAPTMVEAADTLLHFAEQQPEEPKVESLREATRRHWETRQGTATFAPEVHADVAALVLRRVDRVWEWLFFHDNDMSRTELGRIEKERNKIAQMLAGTEE